MLKDYQLQRSFRYYQQPVSRYKFLVTSCWLLVAGYKLLVAVYQLQNSIFNTMYPVFTIVSCLFALYLLYWLLATRNLQLYSPISQYLYSSCLFALQLQITGYWQLETYNCILLSPCICIPLAYRLFALYLFSLFFFRTLSI